MSDNTNDSALNRTLKFIDERGLEKLNEIPEVLRDMADEIERRLKREDTLHTANHVATTQLRQLDALLGMLREVASDALRDRVKIMNLALEEKNDK
jgi:hypothetical protein